MLSILWDYFIQFWDYFIPFVIILTVLVFVHELGHYWVARRNGVRVEVFSVGFGKELWGWSDRLGTRWRLSLIPVGGYVRFFGEAETGLTVEETLSRMAPEDRAVAFHAKRVSQRLAIVAAGPAANFLFALVLLAALFSTFGQPFTPPEVTSVEPDSAAEEAGFLPGDVIVRIEETEIERFEQMQAIIGMSAGKTLRIVVARDGDEVALTATPRPAEVEDVVGDSQMIGRLGVIHNGVEYRRLDPFTATWHAVEQTGAIVGLTMNALGQVIAGTRSTDELGGPVKIAHMAGKVTESGIVMVIWFMALLSINLGLINLFPIPILDGGHLVFYAIEGLRGRPVGERVQDYSFRIGFALVVTLMVVVTVNDLAQLDLFEFLSGLFS